MPRCLSAMGSVMPPIPPPAIRILRLPWGMNFLLDDFSHKMENPVGPISPSVGQGRDNVNDEVKPPHAGSCVGPDIQRRHGASADLSVAADHGDHPVRR